MFSVYVVNTVVIIIRSCMVNEPWAAVRLFSVCTGTVFFFLLITLVCSTPNFLDQIVIVIAPTISNAP